VSECSGIFRHTRLHASYPLAAHLLEPSETAHHSCVVYTDGKRNFVDGQAKLLKNCRFSRDLLILERFNWVKQREFKWNLG
jgi:hypothetical protein